MIRPATPLARLHAAAFPDPWSEAALAGLLGASGALALIADDGFILLRALAGEAEILTLAVQPDGRRRGLGQALVAGAAAAAHDAGAESLFLEVAEDNAPALSLYARCGFEPVGRRNAYYRRGREQPADALVLRKTLNPTTA